MEKEEEKNSKIMGGGGLFVAQVPNTGMYQKMFLKKRVTNLVTKLLIFYNIYWKVLIKINGS